VIGLDTNVLARYFVAEDDADAATDRQRRAARALIESGQPLFLAKTVALELEWLACATGSTSPMRCTLPVAAVAK
jgi:predicted nucleic-acid-binding protein